MAGDAVEGEKDVLDAVMSNPFNIVNMFKNFLGGSEGKGGAETGGGMGSLFKPELAQRVINEALAKPIYPSRLG